MTIKNVNLNSKFIIETDSNNKKSKTSEKKRLLPGCLSQKFYILKKVS